MKRKKVLISDIIRVRTQIAYERTMSQERGQKWRNDFADGMQQTLEMLFNKG